MLVQTFDLDGAEGVPWPDEVEATRWPLDDEPPHVLTALVWTAPGELDVLGTLQHLLEEPPGYEVLQVMGALAEVPRTGRAHVAWLRLVDRQRSWLASVHTLAVAEVAAATGGEDGEDVTEVSLALRQTNGSAAYTVLEAVELRDSLPRTLAAMAGGMLGPSHARALQKALRSARLRAEHLEDPPDDGAWERIAATVERRVLPRSARRTPRDISRACWRVLHELLPDLARTDDARAATWRGLHVFGDGSSDGSQLGLDVRLPAFDGLHAMAVLRCLATQPGLPLPPGVAATGCTLDGRTLDQAAADALVYALHHVAACPQALAQLAPSTWAEEESAADDAPGRTSRRRRRHRRRDAVQPAGTEIRVVVDLATLLGMARRPAELEGFGPISAEVARALAADADWRRFVVDPVDGHLLDEGRRTYRPSARLRRYLLARDPVCSTPHCYRPSVDLDHDPPWNVGGTTSATGLQAKCRRCHNQKTRGHIRYRVEPDGSRALYTALGEEYRNEWHQVLPLPDPPDPPEPDPPPVAPVDPPGRAVGEPVDEVPPF